MAPRSAPADTTFEQLLATLVPLLLPGAELDRERGLIETARGSLIAVDAVTRAAAGVSSACWEGRIIAFLSAAHSAESDLRTFSVASWPSVASRLQLRFEPLTAELFTPVIEVGASGTVRVPGGLADDWGRNGAEIGLRARSNTLSAALADRSLRSVTTAAGVIVVSGSPLISGCLLDLHRLVTGCGRGGALVSVPDDETIFVVPIPLTFSLTFSLTEAPLDQRSVQAATLDLGRRLAALTATVADPGPIFRFHRPGRFAIFDVTGAKP